MWQLPRLPSTREDGEEKPECICFHQKPDEDNYGYVRVGEWQPFPGAPLAAAWPVYLRCGSCAGDGKLGASGEKRFLQN